MSMDGPFGLAVRDVCNQKSCAQHCSLRPLAILVYKKEKIVVAIKKEVHGGSPKTTCKFHLLQSSVVEDLYYHYQPNDLYQATLA